MTDKSPVDRISELLDQYGVPSEPQWTLDYQDRRQCEFWKDLAAWPADINGYAFLGRAIQQVGMSWFPDYWIDTEGQEIKPRPLPPRGGPSHKLKAIGILQNHGVGVGDGVINLDERLYRKARQLQEEDLERIAPADERFWEAVNIIFRNFVTGSMTAYGQYRASGQLTPIPVEYWQHASNKNAFRLCLIGPLEAVKADALDGMGYRWIFVDTARLDELLAILRRESSAPEPSDGGTGAEEQESAGEPVWFISETEPEGRAVAQRVAWHAIRQRWPSGPPQSLSIGEITYEIEKYINQHTADVPRASSIRLPISEDTIKRVLGLK